MSYKVLVETSARHAHVSREDLDILFGEGYELTPAKPLSQPDQYAAEERVRVVGPKGEFPRVVILGPIRKATQVELSATDARSIGVTPPIRESGDIEGSAGAKLIGPKGEIDLKQGVIIAKRHLHCTPEDAEKFNVKDQQIIKLALDTDSRSTVFGDVVVRVSDQFSTTVHIDTDEANAAGATPNMHGTLVVD